MFSTFGECFNDIARSVGHSNVVTNVGTAFLQMFIWKRFGTNFTKACSVQISPKPVQSDAVEKIEIEVDGEIIEKPDMTYQP